jgi:mannose-6-phosphate isomerase-like protein (cupin superfamily)
VVVVQPGAGRIRIDRQSGASTLLEGEASWVVLPAGTHFRVRNDGSVPGVLVFVAIR